MKLVLYLSTDPISVTYTVQKCDTQEMGNTMSVIITLKVTRMYHNNIQVNKLIIVIIKRDINVKEKQLQSQ